MLSAFPDWLSGAVVLPPLPGACGDLILVNSRAPLGPIAVEGAPVKADLPGRNISSGRRNETGRRTLLCAERTRRHRLLPALFRHCA